MSKVGQTIASILRGSFLANDRMMRLFPFAVYLTFLSLIAIYSAHSADRKVHRINELEKEVNELESEHRDIQARLEQLSLESKVEERAAELGLKTSEHPPVELRSEND